MPQLLTNTRQIVEGLVIKLRILAQLLSYEMNSLDTVIESKLQTADHLIVVDEGLHEHRQSFHKSCILVVLHHVQQLIDFNAKLK